MSLPFSRLQWLYRQQMYTVNQAGMVTHKASPLDKASLILAFILTHKASGAFLSTNDHPPPSTTTLHVSVKTEAELAVTNSPFGLFMESSSQPCAEGQAAVLRDERYH